MSDLRKVRTNFRLYKVYIYSSSLHQIFDSNTSNSFSPKVLVMSYQFKDKLAIVTGASKLNGIGFATAYALVEGGADVSWSQQNPRKESKLSHYSLSSPTTPTKLLHRRLLKISTALVPRRSQCTLMLALSPLGKTW